MNLTEKHEAILRKQLIELDKFAENTPDPTPHHSPGTKWWDGDFPAFPEDYPLDDREAIEQLRDATLHYMEDLVQEALCYSDKEHKWIEDPENPWAVAYCTEFKDNKHKFNDLLAYLDLEDDIPAYLA